ncbi:hypothetical protein [Actinobaculum sp. 352]|uniref:hypothetical protein n=1 Tax=Actinobaculum sp. 352 TaxID=2490946 RepID=UPI000F7EA308|nr:hypothetical protein [Actinobaculum sp. 352]RTE47914.1 hypothetical protein EKN07_11685 [Actinobaculum sp. 352]
MAASLTITVPDPMWITSNQRLHWAEKARRVRFLRDTATIRARVTKLDRPAEFPVRVIARIGYPTRRTADPANAEPTVKAIIDGLTDAGIWPDDNSNYVHGPDYRRSDRLAEKGTHTVTIDIIKGDPE